MEFILTEINSTFKKIYTVNTMKWEVYWIWIIFAQVGFEIDQCFEMNDRNKIRS